MKILHVNASLSGGGVEQYLTQVLDQITKRGHHNIILHGDQSFQKSHGEDHKVLAIEDVTHLRCQNLNRKMARVQSLLDKESQI